MWAPAVNGAIVMSVRGGDFELTVGRDLSIGYQSYTETSVRLYLVETMAFRVAHARGRGGARPQGRQALEEELSNRPPRSSGRRPLESRRLEWRRPRRSGTMNPMRHRRTTLGLALVIVALAALVGVACWYRGYLAGVLPSAAAEMGDITLPPGFRSRSMPPMSPMRADGAGP